MQRPPSQTLLRGGALLTSPSVSRSGAAASSSPASASSGAAPVTVSAGAALSATPGPPAPQHWDATATVTAVALAIDGLANEESVESDGDSSASGSPALPHRVLDAPQQATVFGPGMSGQRARRGAGSTATPTSQREGSETEDARPMARFRSTSKPPAGGNNNGVVDSSLLPPPAVGFAQQSPQLPPSPQRGVSQSRPRAGSSAAAPPVVAVGPSRGWARMGGLMRQGKLRRDEADGRARTSSIDERTREDMAMGGVVAPIPPSGGGGGLLSRLLGGGAPPAPQRTDSGRLMASSGEAAPKFLGSGLLASLVSSTRKQHKGASVWMAAATNMAKRDKSDLASVAYRPRATDEQLQQLKPKVPPSDEVRTARRRDGRRLELTRTRTRSRA